MILTTEKTLFKQRRHILKTSDKIQIFFWYSTNTKWMHTLSIAAIWTVFHAWTAFHAGDIFKATIVFTAKTAALTDTVFEVTFTFLIALVPILQITAHFA